MHEVGRLDSFENGLALEALDPALQRLMGTCLVDDLVQWEFHDSFRPSVLQLGYQIPSEVFVDDRVDGVPAFGSQLRDGGRLERGEQVLHFRQVRLVHVQHQTDLATRRQGGPEQQRDPTDLLLLPIVFPRLAIGDELGRRMHDLVDDAQVVGAQRATRLGEFDDGIRKIRWLDLSRSPRELHLGLDLVFVEELLREVDRFGSDALAGEIPWSWIGKSFGTATTQRTGRLSCLE